MAAFLQKPANAKAKRTVKVVLSFLFNPPLRIPSAGYGVTVMGQEIQVCNEEVLPDRIRWCAVRVQQQQV